MKHILFWWDLKFRDASLWELLLQAHCLQFKVMTETLHR